MKNPKISVIIPVYNGEETLTECLNSVLNQSYIDYEVIVVDNNSTDKTKDIIKYFSSNNKKVEYVFEGYRSRGAARNKGIMKAKGKIIVMTDSDCVVPENWVSQITKLIRNQDEAVVQGNESDAVGNYWTKMQQTFNQEFLKIHMYDNHYLNHVDTKNFAITREALLKSGLFNEHIKSSEDYEFKIKLNKKDYKIYFYSDCKVKHYHRHNLVNVAKRRIILGYWTAIIYSLHKNYLKKHPDEMVKSINPFYFIIFFPWLLSYLLRRGPSMFFFELVTGTAWRIGIIYGVLGKNRFLKSTKLSS